MAATADLAGEDAPALFTVGKDGAVFYWMYDAASPNIRPPPQGYAQVPGKHRKRKAPGSDPIQPKTVSVGSDKAAVAGKEMGEATEETDVDSSSSSSGESSDDSERRQKYGRETVEATGATRLSLEITERSLDMQTSTSGRAIEDQQQQTLSFAGEPSKHFAEPGGLSWHLPIKNMLPLHTSQFIQLYAYACPALPCPARPGPALPCPALPCPALALPCSRMECVRARATASLCSEFGLHVFLVREFRQKLSLPDPKHQLNTRALHC